MSGHDGGQVPAAASPVAAEGEETLGLAKGASMELVDLRDAGLGELPGDEASEVTVGFLPREAPDDGLPRGGGLELDGDLLPDLEGIDREVRAHRREELGGPGALEFEGLDGPEEHAGDGTTPARMNGADATGPGICQENRHTIRDADPDRDPGLPGEQGVPFEPQGGVGGGPRRERDHPRPVDLGQQMQAARRDAQVGRRTLEVSENSLPVVSRGRREVQGCIGAAAHATMPVKERVNEPLLLKQR